MWEVLCALWWWHKLRGFTSLYPLQHYLEHTLPVFVPPTTSGRMAEGATEIEFLWKDIKSLLRFVLALLWNIRSPGWWSGLRDASVEVPVNKVLKWKEGDLKLKVRSSHAVGLLLTLTEELCVPLYSSAPPSYSYIQYQHKAMKWSYLWHTLQFHPTRITVPVHIWQCHSYWWSTLNTAALCNEGGEHAHQILKKFSPCTVTRKRIPPCAKEDITHSSNQILLKHPKK